MCNNYTGGSKVPPHRQLPLIYFFQTLGVLCELHHFCRKSPIRHWNRNYKSEWEQQLSGCILPGKSSKRVNKPLCSGTPLYKILISTIILIHLQWRIQDFPKGVRQLPKVLLFFNFFPENCMKMKEFGPPGGARPWCPPPLDPPMTCAYVKTAHKFLCSCAKLLHLPFCVTCLCFLNRDGT